MFSVPWYLAQRDDISHAILSGEVNSVIDGDTLDVSGIGRIRLVGINTPEKDEQGYQEATDFLRSVSLGKVVEIDVDDDSPRDHYGRILGVVYIEDENINARMLRSGHAEILYLPPSEFDPTTWIAETS